MQVTREEFERLHTEMIAKAVQKLPCKKCNSRAIPILCKPPRNSYEWWDDPSTYVGCASCGHFLLSLPVVTPYIWVAEDGNDTLKKH